MPGPRSLDFGDLRVEGASRAADATWFRVHPPGLAFDVGRGDLRLSGSADLFLTHGHLDHSLGVPFVLSQRSRHRGLPTRVFCPRAMVDPLTALIEAAGRLEGGELKADVRGLDPGDRVPVHRDLLVEAFDTDHVMASLGYHLIESRRRLDPELEGLPGHDIAARRAAGKSVELVEEVRRLSYCGDTTAAVLDRSPELYSSEVLLLECTFLAEKTEEKAERYGHIHWNDIVARADRFENRALVLHHLSRRHTRGELLSEIKRTAPQLAGRIHVL